MARIFFVVLLAAIGGCSALNPGGVPASRAAFERPATASNIYIADEACCGHPDSALTFDGAAQGNVKPLQSIKGTKTELHGAQGIAVGRTGEIYVSSMQRVTVYAAGAKGNAPPVADITGSETLLDLTAGIALDSTGNLYVANHRPAPAAGAKGNLLVFAPGTSGDSPPARVIQGPATHLTVPSGVSIDQFGETYVTNTTYPASIVVFSEGAAGNATPLQIISGYDTGLGGPIGIAVDQQQEIFVADYPTKSILVFAAGANGDVKPVRQIKGSKTGLTYPVGIVSDGSSYLYVTNMTKPKSILVFNETDHGNVAPVRKITGSKTQLYEPRGIAL